MRLKSRAFVGKGFRSSDHGDLIVAAFLTENRKPKTFLENMIPLIPPWVKKPPLTTALRMISFN
jgi:hypothetical protein